MMSQYVSEDEDDTEVVMLESGKHNLSKKSCVEPSLSESELEVQLADERVGNANVHRAITDLRLAKAESDQLRLNFLVDMQEMRKQKEDLKKSREGVALLEPLAKRICGN